MYSRILSAHSERFGLPSEGLQHRPVACKMRSDALSGCMSGFFRTVAVPFSDRVGTSSLRRAQFRHLEPCIAIALPAWSFAERTPDVFSARGRARCCIVLLCRLWMGWEHTLRGGHSSSA